MLNLIVGMVMWIFNLQIVIILRNIESASSYRVQWSCRTQINGRPSTGGCRGRVQEVEGRWAEWIMALWRGWPGSGCSLCVIEAWRKQADARAQVDRGASAVGTTELHACRQINRHTTARHAPCVSDLDASRCHTRHTVDNMWSRVSHLESGAAN